VKGCNKFLEHAQRIKPFNYDNAFRENNELKKQHSLLQVKLKAFDYGKKRCRSLVGCNVRYSPKGYRKSL
jgi:hypothetical protein